MGDDSELVKAGVEGLSSAAFKGVNELLLSLFGPAAKEAGLMLKDHVRVFRAERQLRLYRRTNERLQRMGVSPGRVPLKLLFSIVENASMEESDELQDRWANLLAHAADPSEINAVSLSFPIILRELSARDVKFLDAVYEEATTLARKMVLSRSGIEAVTFDYTELFAIFSDAGLARYPSRNRLTMAEAERDDVKADRADIGVSMDMLARHGIIETSYELPVRSVRRVDLDHKYSFTHLGARFVSACREPLTPSKKCTGTISG